MGVCITTTIDGASDEEFDKYILDRKQNIDSMKASTDNKHLYRPSLSTGVYGTYYYPITPNTTNTPSRKAQDSKDKILKLFKAHEDDYMKCEESNANHTQCNAVQRLLTALKHYSALDIIHNKIDAETFNHFMHDIYPQCIDDYTHLITNHSDHVQQITKTALQSKMFSECDMRHCTFTSRHQNDRMRVRESFYKETMDSLHFWLFHQYDVGLRVAVDRFEDDIKDDIDTDDIKEDIDSDDVEIRRDRCKDDVEIRKDRFEDDIEIRKNPYYDRHFSRIKSEVSSKMRDTPAFERYSNTTNNKFTIHTDQIQQRNVVKRHDIKEGEDDTYLEEICNHLASNDVDMVYIKQLMDMVQTEEFDSESIQYDMDDDPFKNNIAQYITDDHFIEVLSCFVKTSQLSSSSFNIGLRFYYWAWYGSRDRIPDEEQNSDNIHDHSGYAVCDLYVQQKYSNLKEEIANIPSSLDFSLSDYENYIVIKVNKYLNTKKVRSSIACGGYTYGTREGYFHYEVSRDSSLGFNNLVSLLLYTDYTKLSSDFTSSFRRKHAFETLQSIKRRNGVYYWMSRTLRETVEIYGGCRWGDGYNESGSVRNRIHGPFYTGMSFVMSLPAFNIRLCSPTSTSKQFGVAMRFSGDQGLVLVFDNPDIEQFRFVRGFNCSWLSRFREEDERLWFGGYHPLRVVSVQLTATRQNFESIIYVFNYFDKMVSGATRMDMRSMMKITDVDRAMIRDLLDNLCHKKESESRIKYDNYIKSSFECFCQSKEQIILNLWGFYEINDKMSDIIMYPLEVRKQKNEKKRADDDLKNLFRPQLFTIFTNVKRITIVSTLFEGMTSCSLSLMGLLSLFATSETLTNIVVTAVSDTEGNNWIKSLLDKTIKKQYHGKQYIISIKKVKDNEYWLDITRTRKFEPETEITVEDEETETNEEKEEKAWKQGQQEKEVIADDYYTVQCKDSELYWDLYDASQDNGAILLQYYYHGNNNQLYAFVHCGDGKYNIHPMNSGKFMQIKDESDKNGAMMEQWDRINDSKNQLFFVEMEKEGAQNKDRLENGCYRFRSVKSNKYIDVPGCSKTEAFVPIQQWESHKGANQEFVIKRVDLKKRSIERGMGYVFEMTKHRGKDCWLYAWFWSSKRKREFAKQLKKNSIEEVISWLVKEYRKSDGLDPWMNCMKDATDDEVQGVIDGLVKIKDQVLQIVKKRRR